MTPENEPLLSERVIRLREEIERLQERTTALLRDVAEEAKRQKTRVNENLEVIKNGK